MGWRIRRMAVSSYANIRQSGVGSPSSSSIRLACSRLHLHDTRPRCVAQGGGDYDRDLLLFTSNPTLLEFMRCTPDGIDMPEFIAVRTHIEGLVDRKEPVPLHSVMNYRQHVLKVPTPQVRGLLTAMAEKARQSALNSTEPFRDGSLMHSFYLAVAAEKGYDAPEKVLCTVHSFGARPAGEGWIIKRFASLHNSNARTFPFETLAN